MRHPLTSLLLLSLLLLQSAGFGITLAWRTLAAESFTARFCVNRATEQVPMCFGSCRMDEVASQIVDVDHGGMSAPSLPKLPVYQPVFPWAGPQVQGLVERQAQRSPHAVPLLVAGDFLGAVFRPPVG